MHRQIACIISITICMFCLTGSENAYPASVIDKIAAVVNEDVITESELQESMLPFIADYKVRYGDEGLEDKMHEARQDALNRLIEERLILQEARKRKVVVEDFEIEERIDDVRQRFSTETEFYEAISASGVSLARLKNKYEEQIMMRKLVNAVISGRVSVSPTQVTAYYHGNIQDFSIPNMTRFKVLLLRPLEDQTIHDSRRLANNILNRLSDGEDFGMLVRQFSQGPNIETGGDMGYMPVGSTIPEIEDAILKLSPGEASGIIETDTGIYIVMVMDKKKSGPVPIIEVSDIIKERLFQRESELTLREFVSRLKEDAYIRIN